MPPTPPTRIRRRPALVWLAWAAAAAASVQLAPNPAYVTVVVAVAVLLTQAHGSDGPLAGAFPVVVAVAVVFAALRVVLTAATTHGVGDVLFSLPEATLPRLLGGFTIGGTIEAPVVARAAAEGWAIVGIIAVFGAFNAVVSHHELVQAAPRAFYELGLAVTVAVALLPATIESIAAVREADLARTGGRVVRRGRLLRQVVPVLESGLARAVGLAESMDSRGFGRSPSSAERAGGVLGLGAMLCLAGGFVALVARADGVAAALGAAGAALLVAGVVTASRGSARTSGRRTRLDRSDRALAASAWAAPVTLVLVDGPAQDSLRWPTDIVGLPPVAVVPLLALAALAIAPLSTASR